MWNKRQRGVTLVELIIAMVIIAAAVAGVIGAFSLGARTSADPMITKQMAAIAEGLMAEILVKPYAQEPGNSTARSTFNDIRDYHDYDSVSGIDKADGTGKVPGLGNYRVKVSVVQGTVPNPDFTLPDVPAEDLLLITVEVSHGTDSFVLTGWRTEP